MKSFPLLVYLHSKKIIRSMDGVKSGVLVRASRPILLRDIIGRRSTETRARKALFSRSSFPSSRIRIIAYVCVCLVALRCWSFA
ncbi:hypothetical protein Bca101_056573 [Brassica carinata]